MPVRSSLDLCLLYGALLEGFGWTDEEIGEEVDHGGRGGVMPIGLLCTSFEPFLHEVPRRFIG